MAGCVTRVRKKGGSYSYRAHYYVSGRLITKAGFPNKRKAQEHADRNYVAGLNTGLPQTIRELAKVTVGQLTERYLKEITPTKPSVVSETSLLKAFLRRDFCKLPLPHFKKQQAHAYIDARLNEGVTARTVAREVNTIRHIWSVAKERWGYESLENPWSSIWRKRREKKRIMHRRKRRLEPGVIHGPGQYTPGDGAKLYEAFKKCHGLNQYYVPLAFSLLEGTGMRLQELFNLTWRDVEIDKRRVHIRKSKTDHLTGEDGREIVLPFYALMDIRRLKRRCPDAKPTHRLFPITKGAFSQAFYDARKRAGIKPDARGEQLTIHDLRREAGSRFDEAGLTLPERNKMLGHTSKGIDAVYVEPDLTLIQDKLDRHVLEGLTLDEAVKLGTVELDEHGCWIVMRQREDVEAEDAYWAEVEAEYKRQEELRSANVVPLKAAG